MCTNEDITCNYVCPLFFCSIPIEYLMSLFHWVCDVQIFKETQGEDKLVFSINKYTGALTTRKAILGLLKPEFTSNRERQWLIKEHE